MQREFGYTTPQVITRDQYVQVIGQRRLNVHAAPYNFTDHRPINPVSTNRRMASFPGPFLAWFQLFRLIQFNKLLFLELSYPPLAFVNSHTWVSNTNPIQVSIGLSHRWPWRMSGANFTGWWTESGIHILLWVCCKICFRTKFYIHDYIEYLEGSLLSKLWSWF